MAIPQFSDDLAIISKLGDNPGGDNNLTTDAFRKKFDEAPLLIQKFINEVLIPAANASSSPQEGLDMDGPINMNGSRLYGISEPYDDDDAVNWGSVKNIGKAQYTETVLSKTSWVASETSGFVQSITIDGMTDENKVTVCLAPPATLAEKLFLMDESPKVKACTRDGNALTFEAWEDPPTVDIPIVVEVVT